MKPSGAFIASCLVLLLAGPLAADGPIPVAAPTLSQRAILIDKAKRTVSVAAHLTSRRETNHCFFGWAGGTNGSRGGAGWFLIETEATPEELHRALTAIGKQPGDNLTGRNQTECVKGDPLVVTVKWQGAPRESFRLEELLSGNSPIEVRFGGNLKAALRENTGCLICLTSCHVAITSNAAVPLSKMSQTRFTFSKAAPPEGTPVRLIFR